MTGNTDNTAESEARTAAHDIDPEEVARRKGVEYSEREHTYEDESHCEASADGRAVVGITNDEGEVLVLVHPEGVSLPNATLDSGDTWRGAVRDSTEDTLGTAVTVGDPIRVRRVEHRTEGDEHPHNVTHHVVFEGSLAPDAADPSVPADSPWRAEWYGDLPPAADDEDTGALADLRMFVDT